MAVRGRFNPAGLAVVALDVSSIFGIGRTVGTTGVVSIAGDRRSMPKDDTKVGNGDVGRMTVSNALALPETEPPTRHPHGTMATIPP